MSLSRNTPRRPRVSSWGTIPPHTSVPKERGYMTRGGLKSTPRALPLVLGLLFLTLQITHAERYLSVGEAQALLFPSADRFEARVCRFDTQQKRAIEKRSKQKVRNKGNRVWVARQDTNLLGTLVVDHVLGKHEIIDYAVAITPQGKVLGVEILEYRESHGYEIRGTRWREQFKGKDADAKLRLNDDIYNISGATISCRHVAEGIKRVLATYDVVLRGELAGARGLPDKSTTSGD